MSPLTAFKTSGIIASDRNIILCGINNETMKKPVIQLFALAFRGTN